MIRVWRFPVNFGAGQLARDPLYRQLKTGHATRQLSPPSASVSGIRGVGPVSSCQVSCAVLSCSGPKSRNPGKGADGGEPEYGKGADGSKNRPQDAYSVWCRVPVHYEPCSESVCVCQLKKYRQLNEIPEQEPMVANPKNEARATEHARLAAALARSSMRWALILDGLVN